MIRRIVFAASIAGVLAGVALTALQSLAVSPLILEAESFEHPEHGPAAWAPEDGWERTLYTVLANSGAGIGFALLLCSLFARRERVGVPEGASLRHRRVRRVLHPRPRSTARAAGYAGRAAHGAADLVARDRNRDRLWDRAPHEAGLFQGIGPGHRRPAPSRGPHGDYGAALAPGDLARRFVCAATWTNGVFWLLLGSLSAWTFQRQDRIPVYPRGRA